MQNFTAYNLISQIIYIENKAGKKQQSNSPQNKNKVSSTFSEPGANQTQSVPYKTPSTTTSEN